MFKLSKDLSDTEYINVYCDLDDTLVNLDKQTIKYMTVGFLYKCLDEKKKLFLITKHSGDTLELRTFLFKFKLDALFNERQDNIIHIKKGDVKSDYIKPDSILIDDQKKELKEAAENSIPAFSPADVFKYMKSL